MGGVVASGWINGWFTLFFLVIYLLERRSGIEQEPR
jgi:hypothetical protein